MKWLVLFLLFCFGGNAWHAHTVKLNEIAGSTDTLPWHRIDLLPVYLGTRIALHRQNPYSASAIRAIDLRYYGDSVSPQQLSARDLMGFAYPLPIALVFAPLAELPWPIASVLYLLLSLITTALLGPLWIRVLGIELSRSRAALLSLATAACWPAVWELRVENIVISIAAFLALGLYALKRGHPVIAGVLISLASLKPQVALLLVVWLILWAIAHHQIRFVATFAGTSLLLAAGSFALLPRWIPDWREGLIDYHRYAMVSTLLPTSIAVVLLLIVAIFLARKLRCRADSTEFGVSVSLCLAMMLTLEPFVWPHAYDHILLVPACCIIILVKPENQLGTLLRRGCLLLISLEFLLGPLSSAVELARGRSQLMDALPGLNLLLPLTLSLTLLLYTVGRGQLKTSKVEDAGSLVHGR